MSVNETDLFGNAPVARHIDLSEFIASPHPEAFFNEPFTVAELDNHPERGRIWATIENTRYAERTALPDEEEQAKEAYDKVISDFEDMDIGYKIDHEGRVSFSHDMVASGEQDQRVLDFLSEKLDALAERLNDEYEF